MLIFSAKKELPFINDSQESWTNSSEPGDDSTVMLT